MRGPYPILDMAKQLEWGTFGVQDLRVDREDDIYVNFPLLELEEIEMGDRSELEPLNNLCRGVVGVDKNKITALAGQMPGGWDRSSWPLPYLTIAERLALFDRRHTWNTLMQVPAARNVPRARYRRVDRPELGFINNFSDVSVLAMAGVYGNVFGPTKDDTKDYHFKICAAAIFEKEDIKNPTRDQVRAVINLMGVRERYNNNSRVVNRIISEIIQDMEDPQAYAGKMTKDTGDAIDQWVENSSDWKADGTVTEDTYYIIKAISDDKSALRRYADDITRRLCEIEAEYGTEMKVKILIYNRKNTQAKKIAKARTDFFTYLYEQWKLRRDNVLKGVCKVLNEEFIPKKKLADFNCEIWIKDQIEGENEPFEYILA